MTKFIKLTEIRSDGSLTTTILNSEHIQCCQMGTKGRDTHVRMYDKSFFFVKESLDDIWLMLNDQLPKYLEDRFNKIAESIKTNAQSIRETYTG